MDGWMDGCFELGGCYFVDAPMALTVWMLLRLQQVVCRMVSGLFLRVRILNFWLKVV